jgi:hypothetical protein
MFKALLNPVAAATPLQVLLAALLAGAITTVLVSGIIKSKSLSCH